MTSPSDLSPSGAPCALSAIAAPCEKPGVAQPITASTTSGNANIRQNFPLILRSILVIALLPPPHNVSLTAFKAVKKSIIVRVLSQCIFRLLSLSVPQVTPNVTLLYIIVFQIARLPDCQIAYSDWRQNLSPVQPGAGCYLFRLACSPRASDLQRKVDERFQRLTKSNELPGELKTRK